MANVCFVGYSLPVAANTSVSEETTTIITRVESPLTTPAPTDESTDEDLFDSFHTAGSELEGILGDRSKSTTPGKLIFYLLLAIVANHLHAKLSMLTSKTHPA